MRIPPPYSYPPMSRFALLFALLLAGCAGSRLPEPALTVEGTVTSRGNEPFTTLVLETDRQNLYVLCLGVDCSGTLDADTPARVRLTGHVYRADWNGRPFAHLRVTGTELLGR